MLTTVLLLSLFAADPPGADLPDNYRAYFDRADKAHAKEIAYQESVLEKAEIQHSSAMPSQKANQRRHINHLKSQLADFTKEKPVAWLPTRPQPGDIGQLEELVYELAIVDDNTLRGDIRTERDHSFAVLKLDSVKHILKQTAAKDIQKQTAARKDALGQMTWIVTKLTPEQQKMEQDWKASGGLMQLENATVEQLEQRKNFPKRKSHDFIAVEALKKSEVAKMRALFEAEKK